MTVVPQMDTLIQKTQESVGLLLGQTLGVSIAIFIAIIFLFFTRYLAKSVRRFVALAVGRTVSNISLRSLFVQTSYVAAWVVGILLAAVIAFPSLRLGDIIGLLGLSTVAIGFAFQDIFKNFLAGILLLLQEPFRLGDQIQVGAFEGTVEDIAIRSTQIRTYQGERIVIPNAIIFTTEIRVLTAFSSRRTDLSVRVDCNTSLSQAVEVLCAAATHVNGVMNEPKPMVDVIEFGNSSINLVVRYWTKPAKADINRVQTRMMIALKQACDEAQINIP